MGCKVNYIYIKQRKPKKVKLFFSSNIDESIFKHRFKASK